MNSSINLFADNELFIFVDTGSFWLFKINFISFLLKEIDPLLCLVFLKSSAILFIKQIDSATFLSICFALF